MKFIFGVLGVILVVIFAIVLIARGGGGGNKPKPLSVSDQNREGTSAQITTQGKLVGEEERRAIRIVVTQNERRLEILNGYEEAVDRTQVYPNTPSAYENFLIAIDKAGIEKKRETKQTDERGACPMGNTYIYQVRDFSQDLVRAWGASCGTKVGTFAGKGDVIRKLFQEQIPDYTTQIKDVDLTGSKKPKTTANATTVPVR
jgi:hypothetical protein